MEAIITEVVRQCVEKGIITSSNGIAIDTTHIEANTIKKVPERIMKHLAQNIFKAKGQGQQLAVNLKRIAKMVSVLKHIL